MRHWVWVVVMSLLMGGCWNDPDAGTRPIKPVEGPPRPLYERLGREKGITRIVDEWMARSLNDPRVNFARRGAGPQWTASDANTARLKGGFMQFIIAASDGPLKYEGREMKSIHAGMKISGGEFDAMKKDLKETLKALKISEKEQNDLFKVIESARKDIVEVP